MKQIRWLIFTILFLGVVTAGMAVSFNLGSRASILNAGFYEKQFEQHNIYDLSQRYVLLDIRRGMNQQIAEPVRSAVMQAVEQSFSPEWTRQEASRLTHNFLGYITSQQSELDLTVDLSSRKGLLLQAITHQTAVIPVPDHSFPQNAGEQAGRLLEVVGRYLCLPDTVDLSESGFFAGPEVQQHMLAFRHYYAYTHYLPYLLFSLLIALLFSRGIAGGCKWFGLALALSSILFMVLLAAGGEEMDRFLLQWPSGAQFVSLGIDPVLLVSLFKKAVMAAYLKAALGLGAVGILLAGCGWWWEHSKKAALRHRAGA